VRALAATGNIAEMVRVADVTEPGSDADAVVLTDDLRRP
jgi:hypothetical protein